MIHLAPEALTPVELALLESAVALAVDAIDSDAQPAILLARAGRLQ